MSVHVEDFLLHLLGQSGDRYIFGAEAAASNPDPNAFDCSELIEWGGARAGVRPPIPDGGYYQWRHCLARDLGISVAVGIHTRGALLFVGDGTGTGRDAITHVAVSLGDGTTIEARGTKWGVGTWPAARRFNFATLIPGIDYTPRVTTPVSPAEPERKTDMLAIIVCNDPAAGPWAGHVFKTDGNEMRWVPTMGHARRLRDLGVATMDGDDAYVVGPEFIREVELVGIRPGQDRFFDDEYTDDEKLALIYQGVQVQVDTDHLAKEIAARIPMEEVTNNVVENAIRDVFASLGNPPTPV